MDFLRTLKRRKPKKLVLVRPGVASTVERGGAVLRKKTGKNSGLGK